jgi:glycosyltransferase involved in cell wall biosynthesis
MYFKDADRIIAVSDNDMLKYKRIVTQSKVVVIPNFMDELHQNDISVRNNNFIVFSGSFSSFQNIEGFKWFHANVWSEEISKLARLILVGSNSDLLLKQLNINDNKIEATGWVEDATIYIKNAKLAIVPLLHGSGTRFKCIEAMMYKTPLIGTYKGTEGIINREKIFILEDNAKQFEKKIIDVLKKPEQMLQKTELAYKTFETEYSYAANKKRIALLLDELMKK